MQDLDLLPERDSGGLDIPAPREVPRRPEPAVQHVRGDVREPAHRVHERAIEIHHDHAISRHRSPPM